MTSITRRVRTIALAAGVFGTLGFGAAAAVAAPPAEGAAAVAAPPAEAEPFYCGIRVSAQACKNCCLQYGYDQGGKWFSDSGECWCANPD